MIQPERCPRCASSAAENPGPRYYRKRWYRRAPKWVCHWCNWEWPAVSVALTTADPNAYPAQSATWKSVADGVPFTSGGSE